MRIASGGQRFLKHLRKFLHPQGHSFIVRRQILSVQIQKIKLFQFTLRKLRDMSALTVRVRGSKQHRVFLHYFRPFREGKEFPFLFVRRKSPVHLQDHMHVSDHQSMPSFRNIHFHPRKDPKPLPCKERIPLLLIIL